MAEATAGTHGESAPYKIITLSYKSDEETREVHIRPPLRPIASWTMDDTRFDFNSSFILEDIRDDLQKLRELLEKHENSHASIFGHTDPSGQDQYNKKLSGRRALALYGLVTRDTDLWEKLYKDTSTGDNWGYRSIQTMLKVLKNSDNKPYYEKDVDGDWGSGSKAGLERFQEEHDLQVDGKPGPNSRRELFKAYMEHLATDDGGNSLLMTDDNFLAGGKDSGHRGDVQGCGEYNPAMVFSEEEDKKYQKWEHKEERNEENMINRRVVVFLFPENMTIEPGDWPCRGRGISCLQGTVLVGP